MNSTKSSGTGTSNNSDDSCKHPSKSKENDSAVDVSANRTEGIVDANDAASQSVVLPNKKSDDQENEEKENSDNASSHDKSESVKNSVKSGGNAVASGGKGSPS